MESKPVLKEKFGFSGFHPGQEEIIKLLLNKKHILAVLSTGAGKSLCYQLPAILFSGRTVVVSPLIALMNDQTDHLHSLKISADKIHSHCHFRQNQATLNSFIKGETKILYMSPEKLNNSSQDYDPTSNGLSLTGPHSLGLTNPDLFSSGYGFLFELQGIFSPFRSFFHSSSSFWYFVA